MGDSLITIVAIVLAAVLIFVFPLMSVSERNDDIAQLAVDTATTEFVNNTITTGKITSEDYDKLIQTITSTGNSYDVELEIRKLDENPGKKSNLLAKDKIGENLYYSVYNSQIEPVLESGKPYTLKEGDMISVNVKNRNRTISQMLRGFFYSMGSGDNYQIAASHSGVVLANGN